MRGEGRVVRVWVVLLMAVTAGTSAGVLGLGVGHVLPVGDHATVASPATAGGSTGISSPLYARAAPSATHLAEPKVESRVYPEATTVETEASINSTALLDLLLLNGSNELVLFNAAHNTSKVVQSVVPGGYYSSSVALCSAGGKFFLAWINISSGKEFWQEVTLSGAVSLVTLPIGNSLEWSFVYGNGTALYASSGRFLVEIDPTTLGLTANYSHSLPARVTLDSVLPDGSRLYLAGARALPNVASATNPYFGYLNFLTGKVTTVSKTSKSSPIGLQGSFTSLISYGSNIFVGGNLDTVTTQALTTVGGYFYEYVPLTSTFVNLSAVLPVSDWGVWALEPWSTTIALSLTGYEYNLTTDFSTWWTGGVYTLSPTGLTLGNETPLFPAGYRANAFLVTSVSGGWFFSGGALNLPGPGAVVAVKV